jgi:TonB family protein
MLVDVVVLSGDLDLFQATRDAIGERNPVWRARSADEAADLLITGRCGVLLIDMAAVSSRADTLIEQVVEQFPDVVVCVAGSRDDEPLLAPLISDGLVYRFMHKPVSAKRAGMFLQAAIRRHAERREGLVSSDPFAPLLRSLTRPSNGLPRWTFALIALAIGAILAPFFLDGGDELAATAPAVTAAAPAMPARAPASAATPRRADPVLSRARAALQAGRLEAPEGRNALDLFQAVLLAQPDQAEARAGLARTVELLLDRAQREFAAGRKAEAERLVQRALSAEPRNTAALSLLRRISPPDTPSQQLAREQLAEVARAQATLLEPGSAAPVSIPATSKQPAASKPAPAPLGTTNDARIASTAPARPVLAAAARKAVVQPDPLAPRYTNANTVERTARARAPRSYGAPLSLQHDIAGMTGGSSGAPKVAAPVPAVGGASVPADEFDRISARDPVYPAQALRNGTAGWVELEFTITEAGTVRDVQVVGAQPSGVFERAATEALADWRFRPRVVNGQPVAQRSTITLRFDVEPS